MCELQVSAGVSQVQVLGEAVAAVSLVPALACGESLSFLIPSFIEHGDDQLSQVLLQALEVLSEKQNTQVVCVCFSLLLFMITFVVIYTHTHTGHFSTAQSTDHIPHIHMTWCKFSALITYIHSSATLVRTCS